jgi:hypothetical protein
MVVSAENNTKYGHTYLVWAKRRIINFKAGIEDDRILEYDAVLFVICY